MTEAVPGSWSNAINTAINHIIGYCCLIVFTVVKTAVHTVYPRRGTQTISYKQVSKRSTCAFSIHLCDSL